MNNDPVKILEQIANFLEKNSGLRSNLRPPSPPKDNKEAARMIRNVIEKLKTGKG